MKSLKYAKLLYGVLGLLNVAMAVLGYILLPDKLVMQITMSGQGGSTMPKLLGLLLPLALFALSLLWSKGENIKKGLLIAGISLAVSVFTFTINL